MYLVPNMLPTLHISTPINMIVADVLGANRRHDIIYNHDVDLHLLVPSQRYPAESCKCACFSGNACLLDVCFQFLFVFQRLVLVHHTWAFHFNRLMAEEHDSQQSSQIAKFMGPTWGPPGSCRPQVGPILTPWTLLSGLLHLLVYTWHYTWECIYLEYNWVSL